MEEINGGRDRKASEQAEKAVADELEAWRKRREEVAEEAAKLRRREDVRKSALRFFRRPIGIVIAVALSLGTVIALSWIGINNFATVNEAAQIAMEKEQKKMEKEQQQQDVALEIESQLAGCLDRSEFIVDFDGLGVPLLTSDIGKVACASAALLESSELPYELVNFAQKDVSVGEVEVFEVGNGKVRVNRGYYDTAFKIILTR
jgi:hypothetical protein